MINAPNATYDMFDLEKTAKVWWPDVKLAFELQGCLELFATNIIWNNFHAWIFGEIWPLLPASIYFREKMKSICAVLQDTKKKFVPAREQFCSNLEMLTNNILLGKT